MGRTRQKAELVIRVSGENAFVETANDVEKSFKRIADATKDADRFSEKLLSSWKAQVVVMNNALDLAGKVAGAFGEITGLAKEVSQQRTIEQAFAVQFRESATAMEDLRSATGGLIDDVTLQKHATTIKRLGLDAQQTADLVGAAAKAAQATGRDVADYLETVAEGVAGGESGYLEDLGLAVDIGREVSEQNKRMSGEMSKLEEQQLAAAIATRELTAAFGDVQLDTAINQVAAFDTAIQNLKNETKSLAVDTATFWGETVGLIETAGARMSDSIDEAREAADGLNLQLIKGTEGSLEWAAAAARATAAADANAEAADEVARIVGKYALETGNAVAIDIAWAATQRGVQFELQETAKALESLYQKFHEAPAGLQAMLASELGSEAASLAKAMVARPRGVGGGGRPRGAAGIGAGAGGDLSGGGLAGGLGILSNAPAGGPGGGIGALQGGLAAGAMGAGGFDAMGDSIGQAVLPMRELVGQIDQLAQSFPNMTSEIGLVVGEFERMAEIIRLTEEANGSLGDAIVKGAPGMLAASGKLVAGFVDDQRDKATILAVMEGAAAIAAFASQDYASGALHTAAAVQYGLIAGGVIGGSPSARSGGSRQRQPTQGPSVNATATQQAQGPTIVINNRGAILAQGADRELTRMVEGEKRARMATNPEFLPG